MRMVMQYIQLFWYHQLRLFTVLAIRISHWHMNCFVRNLVLLVEFRWFKRWSISGCEVNSFHSGEKYNFVIDWVAYDLSKCSYVILDLGIVCGVQISMRLKNFFLV